MLSQSVLGNKQTKIHTANHLELELDFAYGRRDHHHGILTVSVTDSIVKFSYLFFTLPSFNECTADASLTTLLLFRASFFAIHELYVVISHYSLYCTPRIESAA